MSRTITENLFGTHFFSKYYLTILGVILLTVSSKISIPFYPVPMTLQTLVVFFIAASMGMIGFYSTLLYVVLGVLGLPLFANGGGIGYIFSPTFGFLYGMVISAFMIAYILKSEVNTGLIKLSATIFAGAFVIFLCGISHLSFFVGLEQAINLGKYDRKAFMISPCIPSKVPFEVFSIVDIALFLLLFPTYGLYVLLQ